MDCFAYDKDFSGNQFNFGEDANKGNKVYLYSVAFQNSRVCDVNKGLSNTEKIVCETR